MSLHLLEVGVPWPPEAFLSRKLAGLAARGVRVSVAPNTVADEGFHLPGVERLRPAGPRRAALALLARSPRRSLRLIRAVRRVPPGLARRHGGRAGVLRLCLPLAHLRPDVVQFEWNPAAVDHLPLFEVWDCPVVTACRGSDVSVYPHVPDLGPYAERLPEVMGGASAVHCVSEAIVREAAEFGLDAAKARVIRPAVDESVFRPDPDLCPLSSVLCPLQVVMVGLRWEKGSEYAFAAIRELVDRGVPVRLDVVGDARSPERGRMLHTLADLGLGEHVHLLGGEPPDRVSGRLAAADVLLHASVAEGIPNVVLEAMACGLPVVTADAGGVTEAVTDGTEGFVVPPRRPDLLADALERLWNEPALGERMGAAGRATILAGFTLERQLQQFLALYHEVVAR